MIIVNGINPHIQRMAQPGAEVHHFREESHIQQRPIDKWPQRGAKDLERVPPVTTPQREKEDM
eukprot:7964203-Karenia_brevis.AAC.1